MTAYPNSAVHTNSRCSVTAALSKRSVLARKRGSNLVRECVHAARRLGDRESERTRESDRASERERKTGRMGTKKKHRRRPSLLRNEEAKGSGRERATRARALMSVCGLSPFERFSLGTSRCAAIGGFSSQCYPGNAPRTRRRCRGLYGTAVPVQKPALWASSCHAVAWHQPSHDISR